MSDKMRRDLAFKQREAGRTFQRASKHKVASATTGMACPPDDATSFATASTVDFVRPATITFRPSAANRLHNCAPSPRSGPTPIMIAVFIAGLTLQDFERPPSLAGT
jgi:hypothetical protein